MLFAGRRLLAADDLLGEALAGDPEARCGWDETDERTQQGYAGWIAEGWLARERRRRTTVTLQRARLGPLRLTRGRRYSPLYPPPD